MRKLPEAELKVMAALWDAGGEAGSEEPVSYTHLRVCVCASCSYLRLPFVFAVPIIRRAAGLVNALQVMLLRAPPRREGIGWDNCFPRCALTA